MSLNAKPFKDARVETENGWIISVRHRPYSDSVDVWIAQRNRIDIDIYHFDKNGKMIASKYKEGVEPEPTMKLTGWIWEGFRQAINGVEETPDKKAVNSELKATTYHLEDLRKLLKLK